MQVFISCQLGFEKALVSEIAEVWPRLLNKEARPHSEPLQVLEVDRGGVLIESSEFLALQLNFFLKLANRILFRKKVFKAKDFPKLFNQFSTLKKDLDVGDCEWEFQVSASESRLNNEKRIIEILEKIFAVKNSGKVIQMENSTASSRSNKNDERNKSASPMKTPATKFKQKLFVRMHQDTCTVSLDSSGEHLHFRGYKSLLGEAPLRETLAAFCLQQMIGESSAAELAGVTWLDPMAGSGTFLFEVSQLWLPSRFRDYSFYHWKSCPKLLKSPDLWANYFVVPATFAELQACDRDSQMIDVMARNAQDLKLPLRATQEDLFSQQDFVVTASMGVSEPDQQEGAVSSGAGVIQDKGSVSSQSLRGGQNLSEAKQLWIICNPPYGERLKVDFTPDQLIQQIEKKYQPKKMGVLFAKSQVKQLKRKPLQRFPFKNGGLEVEFLIF